MQYRSSRARTLRTIIKRARSADPTLLILTPHGVKPKLHGVSVWPRKVLKMRTLPLIAVDMPDRCMYFRDDTQGVNPYESSGLVTNFHRLTPGVSEYFLHLVHGKQSYTFWESIRILLSVKKWIYHLSHKRCHDDTDFFFSVAKEWRSIPCIAQE